MVCALDDTQEMNEEDVVGILGVKHNRGTGEFGRFLLSAGLVSIEGATWKAETALRKLSAALRNERTEEIHEVLLAAPSYAAFTSLISELAVGHLLDRSLLKRGASTYPTLGETTLICATVQDEGLYPTPAVPSAAEFASIALKRHAELDDGDGLVATGAWLESMIKNDGIHPEIARRRLDEASERGLLRRSTEGSTTQTRQDDHTLHVLRVESGMPRIEKWTPIVGQRGSHSKVDSAVHYAAEGTSVIPS